MAFDTGLVEWVAETMAQHGTVTSRRMFSGAAFYLDGTVFALVLQEALWFKADALSAAAWDAIGAEPFQYLRQGRDTVVTSYRRAPDDCYDDADTLRRWAALALEASARARARKPRKRRAG